MENVNWLDCETINRSPPVMKCRQFCFTNLFARLTILLILIFFAANLLSCDSKENTSRQKRKLEKKVSEVEKTFKKRLDRVRQLKLKLSFSIARCQNLISAFNVEIDALVMEIKNQKSALQITSFREGIEQIRIKNDLELIQDKKSYIKLLQNNIIAFNNAIGELDVTEEQIKADMIYADVMNKEKMNKLINEIDTALNQYSSYLKKSPAAAKLPEPDSLEKIWNEISS